jgi:hypothetical protein
MGPTQFWWLAEHHQPIKMYGSMTQSEVESIYDETYDKNGNLRPFEERFPHLAKKRVAKWRQNK